MANVNVSLVVTVLNECDSISVLLDSIEKQKRNIDEVIFVDAGSVDGTIDVLQNWSKNKKTKTKLLIKKGVNRSEGRNIGIKHASHELVLLSDAGCRLDVCWASRLVKCFEDQKNCEVVAGFYEPELGSQWTQVFSWFTCTLEEDLDESSFIPSARSVALTKSAWKTYGGFPEELDTCEDLVFFENIHTHGKMCVCKKARVYWRQQQNISDFMSQIADYAKGDVQAWHARHGLKIISVYFRYMLMFLFPVLLLLYLVFIIFKFRKRIDSIGLGLRAIVAQLAADLAVVKGSVQGLVAHISLP